MEFFHLIGRGVEKRDTVLDDHDRLRYIHNLYVFNDANPAPNYILNARREERPKRSLLVHIHAFCLMTNHYHLLVSEAVENGISLFMQKVNMGYTKYFNEKYERSGALWQGKYRKVHIARSAHFLYVPFYIHLNPLDYVMPEWREGRVRDTQKALEYLAAYRWSSHLDYSGTRNFPSLIHRGEVGHLLGGRSIYERMITDIIRNPELADASAEIEFKS